MLTATLWILVACTPLHAAECRSLRGFAAPEDCAAAAAQLEARRAAMRVPPPPVVLSCHRRDEI